MENEQGRAQRYGMRFIAIVYGITLVPAAIMAVPGLMFSDSGGLISAGFALAAFSLPIPLFMGMTEAWKQSRGQASSRRSNMWILAPLVQITFIITVLFFA